jgi:Uma2 family endonuclease
MHANSAARITRPIDYPTSDGKPMAETDHHRHAMNDVIDRLTRHYAERPNIYVTGNLMLFYVEGDRRRHVSPDAMVVRGVPKRERDYYLLWEEGMGPQFIVEVTSRTTRTVDVGRKLTLYQDVLRVPEYFLFDLFGDYLQPRLQGYRLRNGGYQRLPQRGTDGRLYSQQLQLELVPGEQTLRMWEPRTQTWLLTTAEHAALQTERANHEATRATLLEAENARLRAELARLQTPPQV